MEKKIRVNTVVDYNIDVKKALQEHPEYENMIC